MPRIAAEKQKCLSRVAYDRIKTMIPKGIDAGAVYQ